jgi:hypothetical protein
MDQSENILNSPIKSTKSRGRLERSFTVIGATVFVYNFIEFPLFENLFSLTYFVILLLVVVSRTPKVEEKGEKHVGHDEMNFF